MTNAYDSLRAEIIGYLTGRLNSNLDVESYVDCILADKMIDTDPVLIEVPADHNTSRYLLSASFDSYDVYNYQMINCGGCDSLEDLRDELNRIVDGLVGEERLEDYMARIGLDMTALPNFGPEPADTAGIWSWDRDRILVTAGDNRHFEVESRRDLAA